jgi:hypothetical protein
MDEEQTAVCFQERLVSLPEGPRAHKTLNLWTVEGTVNDFEIGKRGINSPICP